MMVSTQNLIIPYELRNSNAGTQRGAGSFFRIVLFPWAVMISFGTSTGEAQQPRERMNQQRFKRSSVIFLMSYVLRERCWIG